MPEGTIFESHNIIKYTLTCVGFNKLCKKFKTILSLDDAPRSSRSSLVKRREEINENSIEKSFNESDSCSTKLVSIETKV